MSASEQPFAKCAWRLVPFLALLFLFNYLDRVNVGFAALTMTRDLGFSPSVFGFGAGLLFLAFFLFAIPSTVWLERVGAKRWLFCILVIWGSLSASTAFVQMPMGFYVVRFLLGIAEAGFVPGVIFYLTFWFPPAYRARHFAGFVSAGPLAFIIGAPLSSLILTMDGIAGLHGWQWLFLLEGLPAVLLAFVALRILPDRPADTVWLSAEEKRVIAARLASDDAAEHRELSRALRDPRVIALGIVNIGSLFGIYGVGLWLPQIVQSMGFSNIATGFVVACPYLASMVAMVLWGRSSDKRKERIWHVALPSLAAAAGFAVASITQGALLPLLALSVAVIGLYATLAPLISLPASFLGGRAAAGGISLVYAIANLGAFLGPTIIGVLREQSGGYASGMVALAIALLVSAMIVLMIGRMMAQTKTEAQMIAKR